MRLLGLRGWMPVLLLPAHALACWDEAGQRYGVSPQLLYAIGSVESRLNPQAVNLTHRQRTGSYDIGLMQVNSSNLPALARHGISERDLYDPCTSIHVAPGCFRRHSVATASAGMVSAPTTPPARSSKALPAGPARSRYAWRVYRHLPRREAPAVQSADRPR